MRFYHQEDLNDCGLACLSMLISYHQRQVISPYLLKKMHPEINNGGITFFDLINLGAEFGLKGTAYFCEFRLLEEQTQLPILVNIKGDNDVSHFALLTKINPTTIQILDPALKAGHRNLKPTDFEKLYLGQIVIFQKNKNWKPQISPNQIFYYLRRYWGCLLLATLMIIATNYLWFLANFFVHELEAWLVTKQLNHRATIRFAGYVLGGGLGYWFELCCFHQLQQSLGKHLLSIYLSQLRPNEDHSQQNRGFWELINHQQQTLMLFFTVLSKFIAYSTFFPLLIVTILQSNRWVLVLIISFVGANAVINSICFSARLRTLDREDWEKLDYYNHIAHFLSSFTNFKKRQYDRVSYRILQQKQKQYFKTERLNYYWIAATDLNQQLTQRTFGLAFWFLAFFLILRQQLPVANLLVLSIQSQLLISLSINWVHSFTWLNHQKIYLSNLPEITVLDEDLSLDFHLNKNDKPTFQLENFGFEVPGHFYQLPNSTFELPLHVNGSDKLLDSFYAACFQKKAGILINASPLINYEKDLFAIDHEAVPLDWMVSTNLFLRQPIKQENLDKINLSYWLKRYNLELYQTMDFSALNKEQLQIINFLSLLFSSYELYFLNQPLSAVSKKDQEILWKLLFKLKKDKYLIIFGELPSSEALLCSDLNLDDMI